MAVEAEDPGHIALALLDYRVGEVEKRVETMGVDLTEVARQVHDIPGFIARKFEEQREDASRKFEEQRKTITQNRRSFWDRIIQFGTLAAAVGAVLATFLRGH